MELEAYWMVLFVKEGVVCILVAGDERLLTPEGPRTMDSWLRDPKTHGGYLDSAILNRYVAQVIGQLRK
jgi:hypothetical protein